MNALILILITLIATTVFTGMEIAFLSSDHIRIELDKGRHRFYGRFIRVFYHHPGQYIATLLAGSYLALVVYALAFSDLTLPVFEGFSIHETLILITQVIISAFLMLIFADLIPKAIFRIMPEKAMNIFAVPAALFYVLFYPVTKFITGLSGILLRYIFRIKTDPNTVNMVYGRFDLKNLFGLPDGFSPVSGRKADTEIKLYQNALDFSKLKIRDCMIPRTDIVMMEINENMDVLCQKFIETGYSKIMIYQDHSDNIVGYVHSSDLFHNPESIKACMRKISFVPETMEANKLLSILLHEHKSTAIVVDEFGGTAGMITTEDMLEEIFGEIEDEHDTHDLIEKKTGENSYIFSGRITISDLNENYLLKIEENEHYETLAGYILFHHASFPKINSVLVIENFEFKILRSTKTKIELVEMKKISNL
ncbi:MAG TPA: hemolysin family protein [Prolixibacteraceae bacterium]|nr:hemolysin family protein [Prolixibacteraceae bacterium]